MGWCPYAPRHSYAARMDDVSDLMGLLAGLGAHCARTLDDTGALVMMPGARVPFLMTPILPDEFGLYDCPRCTDAVRDLLGHLATCRE